jgi:hypothetical protein
VRIYIQWTRANPQGWEAYEINTVADAMALPRKPEPTAIFDPAAPGADDPGLIFSLNVQGVIFAAVDHYAARISGKLLEVVAWNDDPADWSPGTRSAQEWTFDKPRPDPHPGIWVNTYQRLTVYDELDEPAKWLGAKTVSGDVIYRPWSEFVVPDEDHTWHGIWVDSDCEVCGHSKAMHVSRTGQCQADDCSGYDSLLKRHLDAREAVHHGWREWIDEV